MHLKFIRNYNPGMVLGGWTGWLVIPIWRSKKKKIVKDCVCNYSKIMENTLETGTTHREGLRGLYIKEVITLCKLILVNPATSAAGERSFSTARRLKTWPRSRMYFRPLTSQTNSAPTATQTESVILALFE